MQTINFKTKTLFENRPAPYRKDKWVLGLDIGYSAIKGFCPNKVFCFPAYARKIPDNRISLREPSETDIRYRDEEGVWTVGNLAYDEVNASEVIDSEAELYGRNRYYSPMFQVMARTGMAIGLITNGFGSPKDKEFVIQAGLPPKYLESDMAEVQEALAGYHKFELQIGKNSKWIPFEFEVKSNNVYVMAQPLGALISASVDKNGHPIPESKKYFNSELIVFDPGFGTLDDYTVHLGNVIGSETFPNLGMREVFARTCRDIKEIHNVELHVPELQNKLENGEIKVVDRKEMKSKKYSFESILLNNCHSVCNDAIEKMKSIHNFFISTDYIIATGGTYDAWADTIADVFKDMEDLFIVPANINDPSLSNVFSNARGYYFYRLNSK